MFSSPGMKQALEGLGAGGRILDLGPADGVTLSFLSGLRFQVEVADLEPERLSPDAPPDHPEGSYQVVLGWDLILRVAPERRSWFADTIAAWLAPGGVLLLVLPLDVTEPCWSYRFRILSPSRLEYRPGRGVIRGDVPSTRDLLRLFPGLEGTGARLLRHGAREFVLRRPA